MSPFTERNFSARAKITLSGLVSGMYPAEGQKIANEDIGRYNGQNYPQRDVSSSAADRRNILPSVESAVDQGKPVPFGVHEGYEGHQMVIIGHQGDKLEIYNPWGDITWVSEDDFVNGHRLRSSSSRTEIDGGVAVWLSAVTRPATAL